MIYYGIIYKASFPNGKVYIGQTKNELNKRKYQHKSEAKEKLKTKDKGNAFYNAINKYGFDSITWEIIDFAENQEELDGKEIYWIEYYKSCVKFENSNGYNITLGGDKHGTLSTISDEQLRELGKDYKNGMSKHEIAEKYNLPYIKAARICNGHKWSYYTGIEQKPDYLSAHANLSIEKIDEIIELFKEIGSIRKVAKQIGYEPGTIKNIVIGKTYSEYTHIDSNFYDKYKKYGNGKNRYTKEQIIKIAELYKSKKRIEEIIQEVDFEISYSMVLEITGGRKFSSITNLPHIGKENTRKSLFTQEELIELYNKKQQGITEKQLMREYNCSRSCIQSNYRKIKEKFKKE